MGGTPSLRRWLLVALVAALACSALLVPAVRANDDGDDLDEDADLSRGSAADADDDSQTTVVETTPDDLEPEEEELQLQPAPAVGTVAIFPNFLGKTPTVRAGQQAEILFGINNEGSGTVKVHGVVGRLYVPYDYKMVAQNFTGELPSNVTVANATVPKGVQSSFAFHFTPFKMLQPMTFSLSATLFYEVDGTQHAAVLYNSTLELIEPTGMVSGETVFLVLLGLGVLTLLGMWGSTQLENLSKRAKRSKKVETGTGEEATAANSEWLQGTFYDKKQGQSAAQKRRR